MVEVIEINAADGEVAQLIKRRRSWNMRKDRAFTRFESEWNKPGESSCFILQRAQLPEMINPLLDGLDMSVEHRAGASPTHLMPGPMDLKPLCRALFSTAQFVTHRRIKN